MIAGKSKTEKEYRDVSMDSSSSLKEFSLDRRKYHKKYVLNEKVEDNETKASVVGRVVETFHAIAAKIQAIAPNVGFFLLQYFFC